MQNFDMKHFIRYERWYAVGFLVVLSYFTYIHNFWNPPALFWDENYHIASAQKYMNGIFFMEPHPPLGKLFIAAGEVLLDKNAIDNQFIGTDYATNPPKGFSFTGYRLFPVLFGWLTVPIIFAIFYVISKRRTLWATLFSFLYVFDNALVVHSRSAMLDSTMIFFSALTILAFMLIHEWKDHPRLLPRVFVLLGFAFACALATKAFALLFILLAPFIFLILRKHIQLFWRFIWMSGLTFLIVYCGIWYIHFARATTINTSLPDKGLYQASEQYKTIIKNGSTASPFAFPYMLRDSLAFVNHYEEGVPRLDLCKIDENGSPWFLWPFGGRAINYRWETPDGEAFRYLYLVANPVGWLMGLIGLAFTFMLLAASVLFPEGVRLKNTFMLSVFGTLYVCYMIAISTIDRVMYLYHYFLPLIFSFILFAIVFQELRTLGKWKLTEERKTSVLLVIGVLVFLGFEFMRPLGFYELMSRSDVEKRNIVHIWEIHCAKCDRSSSYVIPTK